MKKDNQKKKTTADANFSKNCVIEVKTAGSVPLKKLSLIEPSIDLTPNVAQISADGYLMFKGLDDMIKMLPETGVAMSFLHKKTDTFIEVKIVKKDGHPKSKVRNPLIPNQYFK